MATERHGKAFNRRMFVRSIFNRIGLYLKTVSRNLRTHVRSVHSYRVSPRACLLAVLCLLVVGIAANMFVRVEPTFGATNTWTQTDWSGGADGGTGAIHPTDQTGWTKYASLSNISGTASPGNAVFSTVSYTAIDDGTFTTTGSAVGGGFGNGTTASTAVSGSGDGAGVKLSPASSTAANNFDTILPSVPGAIALGSAMIRNGASNDIYVLQGNNQTGFFKYSISGNSWTSLTVVPGAVAGGGGMLRNGSDNDIYVLRGNGVIFLKYSISGDSWTTLTAIPGATSSGAAMIRNGADNDIYVLQGGTTTGFHKYSISGNSWLGTASSNLAAIPSAAALDAVMIRNGSDDEIYLLRGSGSNAFYKYSISGNSWTTLAVVPVNLGSNTVMFRNGGSNDIYLLQAGGANRFYKYSISGNSWTTLTVVPGAVGAGAAMIQNGTENDIYVLQGNLNNGFYKYSISGNSWTTLTAVPGTGAVGLGAVMLRNGADNDIYVLQGNSTTGFFRYSISGNSWTTLTVVSGAVGSGGTMLRNGADNDIYVLQGNSTTGFFRYSISGNSWTPLTVLPGAVGSVRGMLRNGSDNDIYVLRGNNTTDFYKYSISGNSWTPLTIVPGIVTAGGGMIRNSASDQIFILQGNGSTNLWRYLINTVTYPSSGTFTSAVIDTNGAASFGTLSWTPALPSGTTLTLATRSGATPVPDGTWSAWSSELSNASGSAIASPAARYLQYRGTFGTSIAANTPTFNNLSFGYSAYQTSGNLVSSVFNTIDETHIIGGLSWTEDATLPAGTSVTVSLRTASSSAGLTGAWTDFTNATVNCSKSAGTVTCASSAMPAALTSGGDDQYLQYKVAFATTNRGATPTVGSVVTTYATPSVGGSRRGTITVVKTVVNDSGGTLSISDFPLFVNGLSVTSGVSQDFQAPADVYVVTETPNSSYIQTFSGDCDASGRLSLGPNDSKVCIVTNNDIGAPVGTPPVPPLIDVVKVPNPLALPDGPGPVTYTYTLRNIGTVPLTDITMAEDSCSPITLVSGDVDADAQLDVTETWVYRCLTVLQETRTNTVVATGWVNGISTADIASATVVVGSSLTPPLIHVTKVPSPLTLPAGGGAVTYTETVMNPGILPLENILLTDDTCAPMVRISGDTDGDNQLDVTEAWTYTCTVNLARTTTNIATASGEANGLRFRDFAVATVIVAGSPPSSTSLYTVADALASAPSIDVDYDVHAFLKAPAPCITGTRLMKLVTDGNVSTQSDSTVYHCGINGERHPFPDSGTYFSWYKDFSGVQIMSPEVLPAIPIGGNVTYRPGSRMLKIASDPKVYAVSKGGILRWITDEATARALYGPDWRTFVSDIPIALFNTSYPVGGPITLADVASSSVPGTCTTTTVFARDLKIGSEDLDVRPLQKLLQCLGYFPANRALTSYFGSVTESAVIKFQSANGIAVVGTVGVETREALNRY